MSHTLLLPKKKKTYEVGWKTKEQTKSVSKRSISIKEIDVIQGSNLPNISAHVISKRAIRVRLGLITTAIAGDVYSNHEIEIDPEYLLPDGRLKTNIEHWKYNGTLKLKGFPYLGRFAIYSGGGYTASLGDNIAFARATADALEQDSWIDKHTRAVFF